jgi:sulfate permease, SulP family
MDQPTSQLRHPATFRELFTPKLVTAWRQGYGAGELRADLAAGLTVAILAIPLSMAIAIGSGATPSQGLVTSVVAGTIISGLGGTRFQIGGPAAAFIAIVAQLSAQYGPGGLMTATFLAGLILLVAGLLRLGTYIKYVPIPVVLGFTTGIGVLIGVGQIKDFFGLAGTFPAEVIGRLEAAVASRASFNPAALATGMATLAMIIALGRYAPKLPGLLIAVVAASSAAALLHLPVETIASRFGDIPSTLPAPHLPDLSIKTISAVLPSSFTIAFLIGLESLLSAVAADAMAGTRHRSNMEIVAQGCANIVCALFGGLPATGVIARTGTNITAGAKTPLAGIFHSAFVLVSLLFLGPLAGHLALPCLAAVLLSIAWRLLDIRHVTRFLTRAPLDDRVVLAVTLLLTVFSDLNVAISVGVVMASMLFMHRMAETPGVQLGSGHIVFDDLPDGDRNTSAIMTEELPAGVRVFQFRGPLFFGASAGVTAVLTSFTLWPKVIILRMREVPFIDATAIDSLEELARLADMHGCRIIVSGLQAQPREALHRFGYLRDHHILIASNSYMALEKAKALLARVSEGAAEREQ